MVFDAFDVRGNNADAQESPAQLATDTIPIHRHSVRSLVVRPEAGESLGAGRAYEIQGVSFDAGEGMRSMTEARAKELECLGHQ